MSGNASDGVGAIPGRHPEQTGLLLTKMDKPQLQTNAVFRPNLVEQLHWKRGIRLTVLVAPAGSGKTSLLSAWSEDEQEAVAWLSIDSTDGDAATLWSHAIQALRRVCPAIDDTFSPKAIGPLGMEEIVLPRLINALADHGGPVNLVFEDFHRLPEGQARDSVAWLIDHSPANFHLILSSRTEPTIPIANLRARGALRELRTEQLWFNLDEADNLLNSQLGLGISQEDVETLFERTGGWPAGLYLAALSLERSEDRHKFVTGFDAADRQLSDLFAEEVLQAADPPARRLMLHTSILGELNGPVCDAVLEEQGSSKILLDLADTNLFMVEFEQGCFRFHQLLSQFLLLELQATEPEIIPTLHQRAAEWHAASGDLWLAIHHTLEAGDFPNAADLVCAAWPENLNIGRFATTLGWVSRFPREFLEADARLLLVEAWTHSFAGRLEEGRIRLAAIDGLEPHATDPLPDGFASIAASRTMLSAVLPDGDVGNQLDHALLAAELELPGSPWRPVACWAAGWGFYNSDQMEVADRWFEESIALAPEQEQWMAASSSLAYRSMIAGIQKRVDDQRLLAEQAVAMAREFGVESALGEANLALAISRATSGDLDEARTQMDLAVTCARRFGAPIDLSMVLLGEVSLLRQVGEPDRANAVLDEIEEIIGGCADPRLVATQLSDLAATRPDVGKLPVELTAREQEILRFLTGSLSEREIARELFLSHNTVHSHVKSIYRKLEVSSRAEAVATEQVRVRLNS